MLRNTALLARGLLWDVESPLQWLLKINRLDGHWGELEHWWGLRLWLLAEDWHAPSL